MQIKHLCWTPRPVDVAPEVMPVLQTPDHSSFPSGHATEAFAVAAVLHRLMTGENAKVGVAKWSMPFRLAHRIAVNRTIAGLHFPVDSMAGALLGCSIAEALHACATAGKVPKSSFKASDFSGDFEVAKLGSAVVAENGPEAVAGRGLLADLWVAARQEW